MKETEMESPHNQGEEAPVSHLSPPSETSIDRNGLHLIKLLAKRVHGNPQTTQAIAKAIGCFPQTDGQSLWLKTKPV